MLLQRKPLSLATIGDIRARSQRLLLCAIPARSVINSSAAWERSVRGQKDACTPGLISGQKPVAISSREARLEWRQASVAAASTERPSHGALWHKLIDAAIPVCKNAVSAQLSGCAVPQPCKAARCRSDAKRDA